MKITSSICSIICTTLILGILIITGALALYWYKENIDVIKSFVSIGEFIIDTDKFLQNLENTLTMINETNSIVVHNSQELLEIKDFLNIHMNCTTN
jgi:hypothetical protein